MHHNYDPIEKYNKNLWCDKVWWIDMNKNKKEC